MFQILQKDAYKFRFLNMDTYKFKCKCSYKNRQKDTASLLKKSVWNNGIRKFWSNCPTTTIKSHLLLQRKDLPGKRSNTTKKDKLESVRNELGYWTEAYSCTCSSYWESNRASRYKKTLPNVCLPFPDPITATLLIRLDYIPDINLANKTIIWFSLSPSDMLQTICPW